MTTNAKADAKVLDESTLRWRTRELFDESCLRGQAGSEPAVSASATFSRKTSAAHAAAIDGHLFARRGHDSTFLDRRAADALEAWLERCEEDGIENPWPSGYEPQHATEGTAVFDVDDYAFDRWSVGTGRSAVDVGTALHAAVERSLTRYADVDAAVTAGMFRDQARWSDLGWLGDTHEPGLWGAQRMDFGPLPMTSYSPSPLDERPVGVLVRGGLAEIKDAVRSACAKYWPNVWIDGPTGRVPQDIVDDAVRSVRAAMSSAPRATPLNEQIAAWRRAIAPTGGLALAMPDPIQVAVAQPCGCCNGSGRYVSLLVDEPCRTCGGRGTR